MKLITIIFLASFLGSTCFAQAFTPVDYEFQQIPDSNTYIKQSPITEDVINFTSVAANGYGQWAVTNNYRWFLLPYHLPNGTGKELNSGSVGLIDGDSIPHDPSSPHANIRVAANLRGSVRFVWINNEVDSNGNLSFFVCGINDQDFPNSSLAEKQVNISFPTNSVVVNGLPFSYPNLNAGAISSFDNAPQYGWRDMFDICMDAKYLYVVYATYEVDTPTSKKIYLTVSDLHGNIIAGFPKFIGNGIRPTVSCDVRNNLASPRCDIAHIDTSLGSANGNVVYTYLNNGGIATQFALDRKFGIDTLHNQPYTIPYHARVLTGSTYNRAQRAAKGVFIIFHQGDTTGHLIFHKIIADTIPEIEARYLDGWMARCTTLSCNLDVCDRPIEAIANPYDGENGDAYMEFHALYQLRMPLGFGGAPPFIKPLRIICADDREVIVSQKDVNTHPSVVSWKNMADPQENMLICANQMGLHVRWTAYTTGLPIHGYNRSMRYFDEPIEEHTLCVNEVRLKDGSSHFGSRGATLLSYYVADGDTLSPRLMSFHTGYSNLAEGQFTIMDDSTTLSIGSSVIDTIPASGSTLIWDDDFKMKFTHSNNTHQTIKVNGGSTIDYRSNFDGNSDENSMFWVQSDTVKIIFDGGSLDDTSWIIMDYEVPPNYINPAQLIVRTGARFIMPSTIDFYADHTIIDLAYDGTPDAAPQLVAKGDCFVDNCKIIARAPNAGRSFTCLEARGNTFLNESFIHNLPDTIPTALFLTPDSGETVRVWNSTLIATSLTCENPETGLNVSGNYFNKIPQHGVFLKRSASGSLDYHDIDVYANLFRDPLGKPNTRYIYAEGFTSPYNGMMASDSTISEEPDLSFHYNYMYPYDDTIESCIFLNNSTASISASVLWGDFTNGIVIVGTEANPSTTFLCSNRITDGIIAGISSSHWRGFEKLSNIISCQVARKSGVGDEGGIAFSKYVYSPGAGIEVTSSTSNLNLAGIATSTENYAFYNTIDSCNLDGNVFSGLITLPRNGMIRLGRIDTTFSQFAHNNFILADTSDYFIFVSDTANLAIGNIDSNYWGGYTPSSSGTDPKFGNIAYSIGATVLPIYTETPFEVTCGSGITLELGTDKPGQKPQVSNDTSCESRLQAAYSFQQSHKFQEEYQAYKGYINNCPTDYQSWRAFGSMTGANTYRQPDTVGKSLEFRTWLKDVLYYNTQDPMYYCEDVIAIHYSYFGFDRADGADVNAAAAVLQFIVDSTSCDYADSMIIAHLQYRRQSQYEIWQDTVKDSLQTPFDTTSLPTIDVLDLGIIRQNPGSVSIEPSVESAIIALIGNPNPFINDVTINYQLSEDVIANIEIIDILGREVYRTYRRYHQPGNYSEKISTVGWESGTYLVRLSTSSGDVRTSQIKLNR